MVNMSEFVSKSTELKKDKFSFSNKEIQGKFC